MFDIQTQLFEGQDICYRSNLNGVTLTMFEYNSRAVRSYEKAGFRHEGRMRQVLNKEGKRWDILTMGILREEWMEFQK